MEDTTEGHILENEPISAISLEPSRSNELNRAEILDKLRQIAPISLYSASKRLGLAYTTIKQIVKGFEDAKLLKTRIILNSPRAVRIIFFDKGDNNGH